MYHVVVYYFFFVVINFTKCLILSLGTPDAINSSIFVRVILRVSNYSQKINTSNNLNMRMNSDRALTSVMLRFGVVVVMKPLSMNTFFRASM